MTTEKKDAVIDGRESIELDEPIARGNQEITVVQVRKPSAGELRGVSLMELAQLDVTALRTVLPRITAPALTEQEINGLSMPDIMQFGVAVASFLLTKQQKANTGYLDA